MFHGLDPHFAGNTPIHHFAAMAMPAAACSLDASKPAGMIWDVLKLLQYGYNMFIICLLSIIVIICLLGGAITILKDYPIYEMEKMFETTKQICCYNMFIVCL
jgi:hypothetical protein